MKWIACLLIVIAASSAAALHAAEPATKPATNPTTKTVDDRAVIVDEIKLDMDAIKSIGDQLVIFEKDAADAEALAKNPPATVAEADKAAYIDKRKNEEQASEDQAKDARERLKEAQKSLEDAKGRLATFDAEHRKPATQP